MFTTRRVLTFLSIIFGIINLLNAQGYNIEKELTFPLDPGYDQHSFQFPFIQQSRIAYTFQGTEMIDNSGNNNCYDYENDGIPEFIHFSYNNGTKIEIYDGKTFDIKYTVLIDSFKVKVNMQTGILLGFFDIDGDNTKELVGVFDDNNIKSRILCIEISSSTVEYIIPSYSEQSTPEGYEGFAIYDIDNDNFPEIICRLHTDDKNIKVRIFGNDPTGVSKKQYLNKRSNVIQVKNYPNPFKQSTKIEYYVADLNNVQLRIFDLKGNLLRTLVNKKQPSGEYSIIWDGKNESYNNMPAGQYCYQLKIGEFTCNKRMISLK